MHRLAEVWRPGGDGPPGSKTINESGGKTGGEAGIRTLGTGVSPYNGLANRRFRPLSHLTVCGFLGILRILLAGIGYCRASVPTSVPKPTRSVPQISIADDIIAIEDAARLVPAQFHRDALRNAGADHVANGRSPEVGAEYCRGIRRPFSPAAKPGRSRTRRCGGRRGTRARRLW